MREPERGIVLKVNEVIIFGDYQNMIALFQRLLFLCIGNLPFMGSSFDVEAPFLMIFIYFFIIILYIILYVSLIL